MLCSYYGQELDVTEVASQIEMMPTGAYIQELGYYLLLRGFDATIVTRDTTRFPIAYLSMSPQEMRADLERRLEKAEKGHKELSFSPQRSKELSFSPQRSKDEIFLRGLTKFLDKGGTLVLRIPTVTETILPQLRQGHPVICSVDARSLYNWDALEEDENDRRHRLGFGGHYVIVSGLEEDDVIINDPSSHSGGVRNYPLDRFLYALYSFQGYVLCSRPGG